MRTIAKNHPTRKNTTVTHHIPTGFDQTYDDLMNYNGTFSFVMDMRGTMNRYGKLSDKQWAAIAKCLAPKPKVDPLQVLVESCHIPIVVSASSARFIAKIHQWNFNPRTLVVTQIKSKSRGGFVVRVKINWTGNVSECRCCGKALSDWRSQATGVGPYCVKKTGIAYVRNQADVTRFQKEMEDLATKIGEVEVMIKNWGIETGMSDIESAIAGSTPTKITIKPAEIEIPIQYLDWKPETKTFEAKLQALNNFFDVTNPPQTLNVYNNATNRRVQFMQRSQVDGKVKYVLLDMNIVDEIQIILN